MSRNKNAARSNDIPTFVSLSVKKYFHILIT